MVCRAVARPDGRVTLQRVPHRCAGEASHALGRPDGIGLGATGFAGEFDAVKSQINEVLNTNHGNLQDSAAAIRLCIADYTATDAGVKAEFDKRKEAIPYE